MSYTAVRYIDCVHSATWSSEDFIIQRLMHITGGRDHVMRWFRHELVLQHISSMPGCIETEKKKNCKTRTVKKHVFKITRPWIQCLKDSVFSTEDEKDFKQTLNKSTDLNWILQSLSLLIKAKKLKEKKKNRCYCNMTLEEVFVNSCPSDRKWGEWVNIWAKKRKQHNHLKASSAMWSAVISLFYIKQF